MQSEYKSSLIIFKSCRDASDRLSMIRLIVAHVETINVSFRLHMQSMHTHSRW